METTMLHLDQGVLSIIGALGIQTMGIVWWAATMTARVAKLEGDHLKLENDQKLSVENSAKFFAQLQSIERNTVRQEVKIDMLMNKFFSKDEIHG